MANVGVFWVKVGDYADVVDWYPLIPLRCAMVEETVDTVSLLAGFVGTRWRWCCVLWVGGGDHGHGLLANLSILLHISLFSYVLYSLKDNSVVFTFVYAAYIMTT